jgi:predicted permease
MSAHGRVARGEREDDANFWWVLLIGRLRPGVTAAEVRAAMDAVLKRTVAAAKPQLGPKDLPALEVLDGSRGQHETRNSLREPLRTMAIVVGIVLLVACANVANLLLARGRARARELSVRAAIGAPRWRVVRQLFTEGALLAIAGAALGLLAARWISGALLPALSESPGAAVPGLDGRLILFVTLLAGSCAMFFALTPAVRSTRAVLAAGLRETSRAPELKRGRFAGSLVILQLALSMMLVVTAALLARSLRNLDHADIGFDVHDVLTFQIDPTLNGYTPERVKDLSDRIVDGLRATPGVAGVTFTSHPLLAHSSSIGVAATEGTVAPDPGSAEARAFRQEHSVWRLVTGPDFFTTLRIPIIRGRALDLRDSASSQRVVVVNRLLAQQLFKTEDAVGRRVRLGLRATSPVYEIVGVAANARYTSIREEMPPTAYLPAAQQPIGSMTFEIRMAGAAASGAALARDVMRRIDDRLPLVAVRTMDDQAAESLRQERLFTRLAVLLGGVTLVLSAIGLYGLLAYAVTARVPEIGLRMALGAERGEVRWMILRQSLALGTAGVLAGTAGAVAGTRLVASMLYQLAPRDPVTVAAAGAILLCVCALAGYIPARRASRVDPLVALRAD